MKDDDGSKKIHKGRYLIPGRNYKGKLLVHYAPADRGGTSFHWMKLPAKVINDKDLAAAQMDERFDFSSDILVLQRQLNPTIIEGIRQYKQHSNGVILYHLEDHVWLLPPTSPVLSEYNPTALKNMAKIISECDGVVCSSKSLGSYMSRFNELVYPLPHIMLGEWATRYKPTTKRKDNNVRILWTTTAHHHHDFSAVLHALKDVCNRYKNVKVIMWGYITQETVEMIPPEQLEFYNWVPVDKYYECLQSVEADIGIAPLQTDCSYNRAKTPLKYLEYGLMNIAPVVTDITTYECVEHGVTGYRVKNNKHKLWTQYLSELVEDKEKRQNIAQNAHEYVMKNHTEDCIYQYLDAYTDVLRKVRGRDVKIEKA